jgi:hypothetical protein
MPGQPPDVLDRARALITDEQRRAYGRKGGKVRSSPDYLLDKLTLALPGMTGDQRRRLIALVQVAQAVEAAEARS